MQDENRFRLGFILLMVSGSVWLYSSSMMLGWVLSSQFLYNNHMPNQLLPSYITIPMSIPFIIGFCLFFRTDEPLIEQKNNEAVSQ